MGGDVVEPIAGGRIGRYQLLEKLAAGGMAEIYLARVTGIGGFAKNVVLKRILPQLAESKQFFRMFLDEARIAATLQHPNVVQIYDAGEIDGQYFIAMEYLEGADLAAIRRNSDELLPFEHTAFIASSVCAGLHYAHEKKGFDGEPLHIIHRDVTPHNVFLTREGGIKLLDFGIAKAANRLSSTTYGTMKGKLAYMSPEQCQGETIDRRSDIYALGAVIYETTTGSNPHRSTAEYALLKEIVEGEIEPPSTLVDNYPRALEAVVMKALAKRPEDRYQTARELQMALEGYLREAENPVSALMLATHIAPILDEIEADAASRSERWALEAKSYERDLAAAAARRLEGPRRSPGVEAQPEPKPAARLATPSPELGPAIDVSGVDVRTGRKLALVIALAAAAAAAFVVYQLARREPAGAAVAEADAGAAAPRPSVPERGSIEVDSSPSGAAVWRLVGHTPIEALPVDGEAQLRVTHPGYAGVAVSAAAGKAVSVELEPEGSKRRQKALSWRAPEGAQPYSPGEGTAKVTSDPPTAEVWLYLGTAPLSIDEVATVEPVELRFQEPGRRPAFVEITARSYSASGRAEVHPTLTRAGR